MPAIAHQYEKGHGLQTRVFCHGGEDQSVDSCINQCVSTRTSTSFMASVACSTMGIGFLGVELENHHDFFAGFSFVRLSFARSPGGGLVDRGELPVSICD